jgi:hypothetical protein
MDAADMAAFDAAMLSIKREDDTNELDVYKTKCKTLQGTWIIAQIDKGVAIIPDVNHACSNLCIMMLLDNHNTHPTFICARTGHLHMCGELCNEISSVDPCSHTVTCPLSAVVLEDSVITSSKYSEDIEIDMQNRKYDQRIVLRQDRRRAAVEANFIKIVESCGRSSLHAIGMVGIGTSSWANSMFCHGGHMCTVKRRMELPALPSKKRVRDSIIATVSTCRRSHALVVISRILASATRADLEERKVYTHINDTRKALSRYAAAKRGQFRCIGEMVNIAQATMRKRRIDGVFCTEYDLRRITNAYANGFTGFILRISEMAGYDMTDGRTTAEHISAYLYQLRDGLIHKGVTIIYQDLFMHAFLPEITTLDSFGISKRGFTSCRNMYSEILNKYLERGHAVMDLQIDPVLIPDGNAANCTMFL